MAGSGEPAKGADESLREAAFFDGRSNRKRRATIAFGPALKIVEDGETLAVWRYDDIRRVAAPQGVLRLTAVSAPELARPEVSDEASIRAIVERCRFLYAQGDQPAQTRTIVLWSLAAVAVIAGMMLVGIPYAADRLASIIPSSWEKRLGEAADRQARALFPGETCRAPAGLAALDKLSARLQSEAGLETPARIRVVAASVPNAFALPGGKVYILSPLLAKAESPDEIAGVLAHELGHLRHRDGLRRVIANGGVSYLAGLLFGDVTGAGALIFATRTLLGAAYSREAEAAADAYAASLLARLGRPTAPMGSLLLRISGTEKVELSLLHDHPLSADRIAALAAADRGETGPALLTAEEWAALKAICARPRDKERDETK
jgi:Zn-dependent protease with chaperone function